MVNDRFSASNVNDLISVLYIIESMESDYGTYICRMENRFGKAERKITLTKRGIPKEINFIFSGAISSSELISCFIL